MPVLKLKRGLPAEAHDGVLSQPEKRSKSTVDPELRALELHTEPIATTLDKLKAKGREYNELLQVVVEHIQEQNARDTLREQKLAIRDAAQAREIELLTTTLKSTQAKLAQKEHALEKIGNALRSLTTNNKSTRKSQESPIEILVQKPVSLQRPMLLQPQPLMPVGYNCAKCLLAETPDMLFCDACEQWFHSHCVNLTQAEVNMIEYYYCGSCKSKGKFKRLD